ncbi:MAG TPA: hypothetical protein VLX31_04085 [Streptosporangiaceae bacterium]|nr:hypothetical protein [Streptosporangiaceae bacterium]
MGLFHKDRNQGSPGGWIGPGQSMPQPGGPGARPVPARLRRLDAAGQGGDWLRGALRLAPGSLLWEPGAGVHASPVELAAATVVPGPALGRQAMVTSLQTPVGLFQLELDPVLFEMSQELVAGPPVQPGPADPGPWA